jgi:hypothetical protein
MLGLTQTTLKPPVNIPMIGTNGVISPEWRQFFSSLYIFLTPFQNVIPVPSRSQDQINSLTNVVNGYVVYNNTDNSFQGFVDGAWKTFTLT